MSSGSCSATASLGFGALPRRDTPRSRSPGARPSRVRRRWALDGGHFHVVEIDVRRERLTNGGSLFLVVGALLRRPIARPAARQPRRSADRPRATWRHHSDGHVRLAVLPRNVAEVAQRDQVLGIEIECGLERLTRFLQAAAIVERLAEHDMTADVPRLLRNLAPADLNGTVIVARLSKLVCESREDPARDFRSTTKKVFDQGGVGHAMPSEELPRARAGETRRRYTPLTIEVNRKSYRGLIL